MAEDNLFDQGGVIGFTATATLVAGALSLGLYGLGYPIGLVIEENLVPADDTKHAGQSIALAQYDRMFNSLSEKKNQQDMVKAKFITDGRVAKAPDILLKEIPLTKEEQAFYTVDNEASKSIMPIQNELQKLAKSFHDSAILDKRLSEENVEDLFARFSNEIGNLQQMTGYKTADFADIDACRIGNSNVKDIVACTNKSNSGGVTDIVQESIGKGSFTFLMLALGFLLRAEYKKTDKYKSLPKRKRRRRGMSNH